MLNIFDLDLKLKVTEAFEGQKLTFATSLLLKIESWEWQQKTLLVKMAFRHSSGHYGFFPLHDLEFEVTKGAIAPPPDAPFFFNFWMSGLNLAYLTETYLVTISNDLTSLLDLGLKVKVMHDLEKSIFFLGLSVLTKPLKQSSWNLAEIQRLERPESKKKIQHHRIIPSMIVLALFWQFGQKMALKKWHASFFFYFLSAITKFDGFPLLTAKRLVRFTWKFYTK